MRNNWLRKHFRLKSFISYLVKSNNIYNKKLEINTFKIVLDRKNTDTNMIVLALFLLDAFLNIFLLCIEEKRQRILLNVSMCFIYVVFIFLHDYYMKPF